MNAATAWRRGAAVVLSMGLVSVCGCGMKGDPQPPVRQVPVRIADLSARRTTDRIELALTVPPANPDGSTPATDRVEIYALTSAADAVSPPSAQALIDAGNIVGRVPVRPAGQPASGPEDRRVQSGDRARVVDLLATAPSVSGATRYFTAVVVTGSGRGRPGPASDVVAVPMDSLPVAPSTVTLSHDETTIRVAWSSEQSAALFDVTRSDSPAEPQSGELITPAPVSATEITAPVGAFGRESCFRVRAIRVTGSVTAEGPLSAPRCITPADTYPPPAPRGLRAVQENAFVTLTWTGVEATDLAGYIVLRGEGAGENMQPLMRDAVTETTFRDSTVQPGVTYSYAVYAVDRAAKPNISQLSNRETLTVR